MKKKLAKALNEYLKAPGATRFRHAVKASYDHMAKREGMEEAVQALSEKMGETIWRHGADDYKCGDLIWKEFDFGNQVGIAASINIKSWKKTVGRFLHSLYKKLEGVEWELKQANWHLDERNARIKTVTEQFRYYIGDGAGIVECSRCEGAGLVESYAYGEEEPGMIHCYHCNGIGRLFPDEDDEQA